MTFEPFVHKHNYGTSKKETEIMTSIKNKPLSNKTHRVYTWH